MIKDMYSRIYKELLELNSKERAIKWTKDLNRYFKKMWMANKHKRKMLNIMGHQEKAG